MRPLRTALAGVLLGVALLSGCGSSDTATPAPTASAAPSGPFPVTVQAANGPVTIAARPQRIVSLSPTATESLFAIGAGPQVTAVDDQSNFPAEAPKTDLSGFKPNVEAITAREPDLVIVSNDLEGVVAGLGKVGVPVLVLTAATKIDDAYAEIEKLGTATGNRAKADEVVAGMKRDLAALAAAAPKAGLTYYHELDVTPYAATSTTFIGQVYALFGLVNIADEAPDAAGGYPKLSAEFVAKADPDLIFLADVKCCAQNARAIAERPGWGGLKAVENGDVVELDDDVASRWGPRVVDLAEAIGAGVAKAAG